MNCLFAKLCLKICKVDFHNIMGSFSVPKTCFFAKYFLDALTKCFEYIISGPKVMSLDIFRVIYVILLPYHP